MRRKTKCYIYTRVSTSIQVDGYSLDAQKEKLRKYAEYEDMAIVGEYSDEGFSGKNIQGRLEFQLMLNDIQDGKDGVSYVLVFKLSRFGRNAADVLNSLQLMQDFGMNLICVEDGIDSSKDSGKLMISVLSAVAEIERENIRTQTMAGREQKAKEGKWNGGFAPYGYKLENGELLIAEDEVEVVRLIYDRYIHTNDGINGVAKYLNDHGYTKKIRQNGTIPGFSSHFVKDVLDNPVHMGKIAYGRRRTEKKQKDGNWIKNIVFNFPVPVNGRDVKELPLEIETTLESIVLLSKLRAKQNIEVELEMSQMDLTAAESKATYEEIKAYVLEYTGLKVSNLYIAQVKEKCGIIERVNYNLPKSENSRQPKCLLEKEKAIRDALEHFKMI